MGYHIAIVDDDNTSLIHAKTILSEEDMRVDCMESGKEFLKYVESNTPDLILMDIMMPGEDGFETYIMLRRYEEHAGKPHIPVIFISGEDDTTKEEMGLIIGASDFIRKPLQKDVLVRRIINSINNNRKMGNLEEAATIDKLTGFFNKAKGTERISKLCLRKKGALMILDLDSFKLVNDLFGHEMGDKVLKAFADIAKNNSRETDTLCRIGGDEFMGFYEDLTEEKDVGNLARRLNSQFQAKAQELLGEDNGIPLGISIGVVMVPDYGTDYRSLFAMADGALYKVKQNGKHGHAVYGADEGTGESSTESAENKLDRLVQIIEERNDKSGALLLGRDHFSVVYKFVKRFYRRYGGDAAILLLELESPVTDIQYNTEMVEEFSEVVEKALRMSDIMVQSGNHSFLVILTECKREVIDNVINRMLESFKATEFGKEVNVKYFYKYSAASADNR